MQPDPRRCSPLLTSLLAYFRNRWGGQNLGCFSSRPVTGGTSLSSHGSGAALDWRYENPGPGLAVFNRDILPFLIDNSRTIGVQAIHDYRGSRIWRPPGTSGRPHGPSSVGWRAQNPSTGNGMGQAWATYIHVEVLNSRWGDTRTIDEMLRAESTNPPPPDVGEPPTEVRDMFDGFWRMHNDVNVFSIFPQIGKKTLMLSPEHLSATVALMQINGYTGDTLTVRVCNDANMFRAFGIVEGPIPSGCDAWGVLQ